MLATKKKHQTKHNPKQAAQNQKTPTAKLPNLEIQSIKTNSI
jgi:hypothetical protein